MANTDLDTMPDTLIVRHVLLEASNAGVVVGLDEEELIVSGPTMKNAEFDFHIERIKSHKDLIVHAIQNVPMDVIEKYYSSRLRTGNSKMKECVRRIDTSRFSLDIMKAKKFLNELMTTWETLEAELRRIFPEFQGCPVGGCVDDAIVTCQNCCK